MDLIGAAGREDHRLSLKILPFDIKRAIFFRSPLQTFAPFEEREGGAPRRAILSLINEGAKMLGEGEQKNCQFIVSKYTVGDTCSLWTSTARIKLILGIPRIFKSPPSRTRR